VAGIPEVLAVLMLSGSKVMSSFSGASVFTLKSLPFTFLKSTEGKLR
jgi:hypothetical protein